MLFHDLAIFETKLKECGTQFLIYIYICHESLCGGTEISNYYILVNTSHIVLHKFCVLSIYLFFSHLLCIGLSVMELSQIPFCQRYKILLASLHCNSHTSEISENVTVL